MKLAFIDTETTGLDPSKHEVIEIAFHIVEDGKLLHWFQSKIRPQRIEDADQKALEINGYAANSESWSQAPTMEEVGPVILPLLRGCILVGHNVSFDEEFLKQNLQRASVLGKIPYHKIDTVTLVYEHLFPLGLQKASLDSVRDFLGWPKEGAHTAMRDVSDTRNLFELCWGMGFWGRLKLRIALALKKKSGTPPPK